jgi:hypothetical protein
MTAGGQQKQVTPPPTSSSYLRQEDPGLEKLPGSNRARTIEYIFGNAGRNSVHFAATPKTFTIACDNAKDVRLAVWPEVRAYLLDHRHAMMRGRVVAKIKNVGGVDCSELRLRPGEEAYWWMGPDLGEPLNTEFWRINRDGSAARLAVTNTTRYNRDLGYKASDVCIGSCPRHDTKGRSLELVLFSHNSTWITCLDGCCQAAALLAFAPL